MGSKSAIALLITSSARCTAIPTQGKILISIPKNRICIRKNAITYKGLTWKFLWKHKLGYFRYWWIKNPKNVLRQYPTSDALRTEQGPQWWFYVCAHAQIIDVCICLHMHTCRHITNNFHSDTYTSLSAKEQWAKVQTLGAIHSMKIDKCSNIS